MRSICRQSLAVCLWTASVSCLFAQSNWTVVGWNNLGMHCMDSDYSVFSILPPYNVIHAQVIDGQGDLVTSAAGIGVTYHAVADLAGSINRTSAGKTGFWDYEDLYFGLSLDLDEGLPVPGPGTFRMPGTNNIPQGMLFESGMNWFAAYGVPIAPYDDNQKPNQYPMMRLMVTNASGQVLAISDIVLPVSDEMDCKLCHASGSGPDAEPQAGWVWAANPARDYRLNILRLHDAYQMTNSVYTDALATHGYASSGLYATVVEQGRPILCASCHLSEALPGSGLAGIPPLTEAMHSRHEQVVDPRNGLLLGNDANRQACYTCHPGSETRCLRGAMGRAVASDGSMKMQCQSCHGSMADVGSPLRTGWLDEPNCQACHVGSATNSFGVIRFADALVGGQLRTNTEPMFATNPDTPAPGHSLYRFSRGHGGLQCSACHGSTHAIYPTAWPNDNLASIQNQGHAGTLNECTACHASMPNTRNGGPHGMHRIGQSWINDHNDAAQQLGKNACRTCHGQNGEGTVLSLAFSDRAITSEKGNVHYWKGQKVTCWGCHDGMNESDPTTKGVPTVTDVIGVTTSGVPVAITLNGSNLRIVDPPQYGLVGLNGSIATYYPDASFAGQDTFTFAANNGYNDSNLGTATVTVDRDPGAVEAPEASHLFAALAPANGTLDLGLATSLGDVYRIDSTTNLTGDVQWDEGAGAVWGRSDVTWIPDPAVFDFMRHFRAVGIAEPPFPSPAQDDGMENAYDGGWTTGSNGGQGFGAWTLSVAGGSGGFFMAETTAIDLNADHRSWGLYADGGTRVEASRILPAPLQVGDALALYFENNYVNTGGRVGIDFLNASGSLLAEFLFVGGQATYRVDDRAGSRATWIPWSDQGWTVTFRLAADGQYHLSCNDHNVPGFLKSLSDLAVASVKVWNDNAGGGSDHDLFINDLIVYKP